MSTSGRGSGSSEGKKCSLMIEKMFSIDIYHTVVVLPST